MGGLFSTLNTGNLGLQAQQAALNVTSHNVANANTDGYTRERADLAAVGSTNVSIDDSSRIKIGTGVTITDITRIRDTLLDYQVRNATTANSTVTTTSNYLSQIQDIMNEPSNTGLSSLIGSFFSDWSSVSNDATTGSSARTTVVEQTKTLTDALNNIYTQLQNLKTSTQTAIQNQVLDVNTKLNSLDSTNQKIMDIKSSGAEPNDLLDTRDLLLDQLSQSFNVGTASGSLEGITVTTAVASASGAAAVQANLVVPTDTASENRLAYISDIQATGTAGSYQITYYKNGDVSSASNKVTLNVTGVSTDELKNLQENRVLLTNKDGVAVGSDGTTAFADGSDISNLASLSPTDGVFSGLTQTQQSIDTEIDKLNSVAKAIALTVNTVESGTDNASPFFVNASAATYTTDTSGNSILDLAYTANLTSNEEGITAGNISINKELLDNPNKIEAGKNNTSGSGDGTRALAISQLANLKLDIQDIPANANRNYFSTTTDSNGITTVASSSNGQTVSNYYTNEITSLAQKTSAAKQNATTQAGLLNSITQTRTSVSGVSTDEEMTNLIQYNHAYQANAKIISTVDSLLDVVINGLKK
ncbi:flagellar hook-associated protein 1 FlgK [Clostridium acidisoli DSM 12555]|uniref:Flagellar hook-associated protein 1 n=1 Tax=Clostridium acidisoli DSM 12555 TaxID=1121291 RepID=A0A1W1X221_9CLOT|nr:flagellar hook-associated protein FlgK [Clostridium acidisoli]SMC17945.1 flagellar hook-associated protein 1 FlgK [Clostridium acidisoli DSM 12555]